MPALWHAQLGGDDVTGWDKIASGLDFGPNVLSFDVLGSLRTASELVVDFLRDGQPQKLTLPIVDD